MIGVSRRHVVFGIVFMSALGLLAGAVSMGGKGYMGHPISFDPGSVSVELALNGAGRQMISLTSQETLDDVVVWINPAISPFVTAGAYDLGTLEEGWGYELDLEFVTPEDAVPGCYEGTIHLRVGSRTVAKPLPVSIKILDEWVFLSDWRYRRYDLAASACNPVGSSLATGDALNLQFTLPGADHYILSGDVDGDWKNEIITTSGSTLNIYSGTGEPEQSIALPRECQLAMLEDTDGDGTLDIGLGSRGDGFAAYIYKADGTLLKTLEGAHGGRYGDHSMIPLTLSKGKMLMGYNAGYSRTPRGLASFDYATGIEEWYYQVGPANGWYSVVDMDADGILDITMNAHTVHNGAFGNGTTDGDIYLMVLDELGVASLTQKYPSPSNGWALHAFADMDGDGIQEILGFEGHDPRYYPGQAQIHMYDNAGNMLHTFNGMANTGWDYAVGDLDGDRVPEVVASSRSVEMLYILDSQLSLAASARIAGRVKLTCDLTGDGVKEIVLLTNDGLLKVLDSSLALIDEAQCGDRNGNVIASDVDSDGVVELLVMTDQLYVYAFSDLPKGDQDPWPSDAVEFNGNYYKLFTDRRTWLEAKEKCIQMGGHLACITSMEENEFIHNLVGSITFPTFTCAWLGGYDFDVEGKWSWVTGEPMLVWDGLLSHGGTHENFLNLRLATGQWEDYSNAGELVGEQWYVCEWDSDENPSGAYTLVADSVADFSGVQGYKGWWYGYSDGGGFQEFPGFDGSSWGISSSYWTSMWKDGTHPNSIITSGGKLPADHTTIRRWICPESGAYQIKGRLEESGEHPAADGVTFTIADKMYELNEGDPPIEFQFDIYLAAGDAVDIELAPNSNDFTDGTYTKIEIYKLIY